MKRIQSAWRLALAASVSTAALVGAHSARAEQAAHGGEAEVGEVVVTALRREATVQNTAAALTALTADQLERAGVGDTGALQFQTPGLMVVKDSGQQAQVFIRGVGNNLQGISAGNSVATYVDGVYIPNSIQAFQEFNDVERVEVLKGPQATLYGRNATGGAVSVVSAEPAFENGGKVDASIGNYKSYTARGTFNAVLLEDTLAARISFQALEHEGYVDNLYLGNHMQGQQSIGVRGALRWRITPDLEATLRADYSFSRGSDYVKIRNPNSYWYLVSPVNQYVADPRKILADVNGYQPMYNKGLSAHFKWDTPLGFVTSVTSHRYFKSGPNYLDLDQVAVPPGVVAGAPYRGSYLGDITTSSSFYHETYLTTDDSRPVSAILGFNYFSEDAREYQYQYAGGLSSYDRYGRTEAYSFFVDANWKVTPEVTLSAGVRLSNEKRLYEQIRLIPRGPWVRNAASWSATSPRFGIEYRPREGLLLYANATSGFKSGGFNLQNPLNPFRPEKIWSYEAGVKTSFLERRLRTNLSAFYYDYSDIQVSQTLANLQRVVTNAGTAKIWGLDADASWAATADLTLGVGLSLLHTEYGSATLCDPARGSCGVAGSPAFVDVEGNRLPRAPELSANFTVDYTLPQTWLPGDLVLHADASYRSRTYWTPFEFEPHSVDGQWLANAQLRYDDPKGWFVAGYVQNLFDELYVTNGIGSAPLRTGNQVIGEPTVFDRYTAPRTYGLRVGFSF